MEQKKKIRLADIAKEIGVSSVTISKALTDKEGVSDDLRKQIKQLAESMGYKTKKLKTVSTSAGTTGNIGILIPSRFFSRDSSYYWYLFNFLSKELLSRNYYSIMELLSDNDEKNLVLPRMLSDNKVDGLIVLGQTNDDYLEAVSKLYKTFILLDFYSTKLDVDSVSNDDYYFSYKITNYVISQGHKKLRFVGNFEATTSICDRYMGFQKAMLENSLQTTIGEIIPDRDENGKRIEIPLPEDMPTAFICNCDETAALLINQLEEKGIKVPEDVSVSGYDNYVSNNKLDIGLTTVYIHPESIVRIAADLIIRKITGTPYMKARHLVSGELIIRESVQKNDFISSN